MSTWSWISKKIERNYLGMSLNHVEMIIKVTEELLEMIRNIKNKDYDKAKGTYKKVFEAEREADVIKRSIITELSKGTIHPIDREELIRLVLSSDDIATYSKASARRLIIILDLGFEIPSETLSIIEKMAEKNSIASKYISSAISALIKNTKEALKIADEIERVEEEVDDIRMLALRSILKKCSAPESNVSLCLLVKDVIDSIENSVDRCEDVADVIRSIAILT